MTISYRPRSRGPPPCEMTPPITTSSTPPLVWGARREVSASGEAVRSCWNAGQAAPRRQRSVRSYAEGRKRTSAGVQGEEEPPVPAERHVDRAAARTRDGRTAVGVQQRELAVGGDPEAGDRPAPRVRGIREAAVRRHDDPTGGGLRGGSGRGDDLQAAVVRDHV